MPSLPGLGDLIRKNYLPPCESDVEIYQAFNDRIQKLWTLFWAEQGATSTYFEHYFQDAFFTMSSQKTNRKVAALNCVFDGFNVGTGTLVLQAKFLIDQSKRTTCAGSCSVDPYDSEDEEADPEWVWNQISASKNIGSITPDQIATLYLYVGKSQKRDADIECPKGIFLYQKAKLGALLLWPIPIYIIYYTIRVDVPWQPLNLEDTQILVFSLDPSSISRHGRWRSCCVRQPSAWTTTMRSMGIQAFYVLRHEW